MPEASMALRLFVLSALLLTTSVIAAQTSSSPDPICDVTRPNGRGAFGETPSSSLFGNGALSTGLWPDGTIEFKPGGPGFVTRDGALGMKFLWRRGVSGRLKIDGHRLDAPAPALRSEIGCCGYGDIGIQPSYVIFPTPGC